MTKSPVGRPANAGRARLERRVANALGIKHHRCTKTGIIETFQHLGGSDVGAMTAIRCLFISPGTNGAWIHERVRRHTPRTNLPIALFLGDGAEQKIACRLEDFELVMEAAKKPFTESRNIVQWQESKRDPDYLKAWMRIMRVGSVQVDRVMVAIQVDGSNTIAIIFRTRGWNHATA